MKSDFEICQRQKDFSTNVHCKNLGQTFGLGLEEPWNLPNSKSTPLTLGMTVELASFTWVWKSNRVKDGANCADPVPIGREQLSLFSIYKINFKKKNLGDTGDDEDMPICLAFIQHGSIRSLILLTQFDQRRRF